MTELFKSRCVGIELYITHGSICKNPRLVNGSLRVRRLDSIWKNGRFSCLSSTVLVFPRTSWTIGIQYISSRRDKNAYDSRENCIIHLYGTVQKRGISIKIRNHWQRLTHRPPLDRSSSGRMVIAPIVISSYIQECQVPPETRYNI